MPGGVNARASGGNIDMNYLGKVAVITGGASGIGLATAKQFAQRGSHVVLVDRDAAALRSAAQSVRASGPVRVETRVCDVTDFPAMQTLAADVYATLGGVAFLFNNAGVAVGGPIAEMSHDDWRWIIDVDLWGPIHGVEAFLPRMIAAGDGGHILFTASFAGLVPNVGLGPYCVAKYGVVALAEVLRREVRDNGIGVSVLCPMRVKTNIGTSERNRDDRYGGADVSPPVPDQDDGNSDLAGRVLDVDDVAAAVLRAIDRNELYILPHAESRAFIRRRFERLDQAFDAAD
jgi:NAD(P)-dependent dehydrogenase (short-subunit alcohol dehydrogenase family)